MYKIKSIRIKDKVWDKLKKLKVASGKNWSKFIEDIIRP